MHFDQEEHKVIVEEMIEVSRFSGKSIDVLYTLKQAVKVATVGSVDKPQLVRALDELKTAVQTTPSTPAADEQGQESSALVPAQRKRWPRGTNPTPTPAA